LRRMLIFSTELVLGPVDRPKCQSYRACCIRRVWGCSDLLVEQEKGATKRATACLPMVPMMEVRRKFFAGRQFGSSLDVHSSLIRFERWPTGSILAQVRPQPQGTGMHGASEQ